MGRKQGVFMLKVNGIGYHYPNDPWLFRNINLSICPGEILGLYGLSGAGKTTMAKIVAGYVKPLEGNICVDGHTYDGTGIHPVQLVWQHPEKAINPKWRMRKMLAEGVGKDDELLTMLGIKREWLNRWPSELSGGELQRFCLARALGRETRYLIADEMTTMLDAITQAQIWQTVLKLVKERNLGVLVISHNQHLLHRVSDRILNFNDFVGAT